MFASSTHKVFFNTLYQVLGRLVSAGETLLATALITRALGPAGYGEITIIFTYVTMFFVMADFGINSIVVREWSSDRAQVKRDLTQLLFLRLILALGLAVVAGGVAIIASKFSMDYSAVVLKGILVGLVLIVGQAVYFSCTAVFQTFFSYAKSFWASLWGNLAALVCVLLALAYAPSVISVTLALITGSLFPSFLALYFVKEYLDFRHFRVDLHYQKKLLKASLPTGIGLIINTILVSADRLLLSVLSTAAMVGIYGLAYKIFENILVLPNFLMNAVFPILIARKLESKPRLNETIQKTFDALSVLVFPLVVGGCLLADVFVGLIGGVGFEAAGPTLVLLFLGVVVYFYSPLFRWLLIVERQERLLPFIYGIGLIANVGLNLVAIPRYGIFGAAVVNAVSEFVILALCFGVVRKSLSLRVDLRVAILSLLSSLVMAPFVWLFKDWLIVGPIVLGALAYFLIFYFLSPLFKVNVFSLIKLK